MNPLRARPYRDETPELVALMHRSRPPEWITDYPGANDLRELLAEPSIQKNTRVWQDANGMPVAYALVDDFNNLLFDVLPDARGETLDAEIFAWGVQCMQCRNAESGTQDTLDAVCRAEDAERIAWLERFGFQEQPRQTVRMIRDLQKPIPDPVLPDGFVLRSVRDAGEADALAALHRAAFGSDHLTAEMRLAWMQAPHYDAALDLVVQGPDSTLVASCFGTIDPEENRRTGQQEGSLDPLATHPKYQGRGLARACLLEGLWRLKQRGMQVAVLGTSSENTPMQKAARGAGFEVDSVRVWYSKKV